MASTMDAAQAVLTAFDTSMSRHWREEDRRWRAEDREWRTQDIAYREVERKRLEEEAAMRAQERSWREEDVEQRHVDNVRYLWTRFVEKNRRDVEEKSEQLKAISNLAALFAGFAVVTLTQFDFDFDTSSTWIIASFGVLTAISICLHTIAMVLCTLILGSILKNGKTYVDEEAEEEFVFRCRSFIHGYQLGDRPPAPRRTFEAFWEYRCEADWRLAFNLFTWGVFSFLLELIPIGWIKFYYSTGTASAFTAICVVSILVWAWTQWSWGSYLTANGSEPVGPETSSSRTAPAGLPFDWHIAPEKSQGPAPISSQPSPQPDAQPGPQPAFQPDSQPGSTAFFGEELETSSRLTRSHTTADSNPALNPVSGGSLLRASDDRLGTEEGMLGDMSEDVGHRRSTWAPGTVGHADRADGHGGDETPTPQSFPERNRARFEDRQTSSRLVNSSSSPEIEREGGSRPASPLAGERGQVFLPLGALDSPYPESMLSEQHYFLQTRSTPPPS